MKNLFAIVLIIILSGCASKNINKSFETQHVSMIQLVANPEKYDGKSVILKGYFIMAFEENVLYFSKQDYDYSISKNGIWIAVNKEFMNSHNIDPPYNGYIAIEGVFHKNNPNLSSLFSGGITHISDMYRLQERTENSTIPD